MKIGLISDIHSNAIALETVLSDGPIGETDEIYCAGDLVGYYSQPNDVINSIRNSGIRAVKGNHDVAVLESTPSNFSLNAKRAADWNRRELSPQNREYLSELPTKIREFVDSREIMVVHGSPKNPITEYIFEADVGKIFLEFNFRIKPDLVVLGHTHKPYIHHVEDTLVVNPGSVGQPRDRDPRASYAVIDTDNLDAEIHRVEYDIEQVVDETHKELPRSLGDRLFDGT